MKNEFIHSRSLLDLVIKRRKESREARLAHSLQKENLHRLVDLQSCTELDKSENLGNAEFLQVQKEEIDLEAQAQILDPEVALNQFLKSVIHSVPVPDHSSLFILKVRRGWFSILGHSYFVHDLSITNISEIVCICDEGRRKIHVYLSDMTNLVCSIAYPKCSH